MILFPELIMFVWLREFDEASQKHGGEAADGRSETQRWFPVSLTSALIMLMFDQVFIS